MRKEYKRYLYKAIKWEVEHCSEGVTVAEIWEAIHKVPETEDDWYITEMWIQTCTSDYKMRRGE